MAFQWTRLPDAIFPPMDGLMGVQGGSKFFIMGGWNPLVSAASEFPNHRRNSIYSVASFADLQAGRWALEKLEAQWSARHTFGLDIGPDDRIHVFGSDVQDGFYRKDHWDCSTGDVTSFRLLSDNTAWGNRVLFQHCLFNGKLTVLGGQTLPNVVSPGVAATRYTDIWTWDTTNGWVQAVSNCPALPRSTGGRAAVLNNRIYLIAGGNYTGDTYNSEVWRSGVNDLTTWSLVTNTPGFSARGYPNYFAWDGKLFVVCGYNGTTGNTGDTWVSEDEGATWENIDSDIPVRHACFAGVYDSIPIVVGGNGPALRNDVYQLDVI